MPKDTSPTASIRSVASSRSRTLSRPPPPPKPSHLASSFTGTCNSIALRHYIQTHTTGGSFSTQSPPTATISLAHLGHGYDNSTVDHFVDAFDTSSEDEQDVVDRPMSRPSARGRTYTAPSVSRMFEPSSDDTNIGDGTTRLIRNEPVAIDGSGPSRVGNLRSMFEAAMPFTSTPVALSRQNTGITFQHTGSNQSTTKAKPRISNQVRMLQAQITGERFNGVAGAFNVAEARSSIILQKNPTYFNHRRDATDQSEHDSIYRTASQDLLGDALKMDAVVMPPTLNTETLKVSPSGSFPKADDASAGHASRESSIMGNEATISRSTSAKNDLTSSRILIISAQHDRDDSSATIRPSHSNTDVVALPRFSNGTISSPDATTSTVRHRSSRLVSGSKKDRLSFIFTASPQSSHNSGEADRNGITPSPSGVSTASRSASEAESEAESEVQRSREPSMLVADDDSLSFSRTSHHLTANDGSCFDLDWGSNASPTKAASVRRAFLNAATSARSSNPEEIRIVEEEEEEAAVDANSRKNSCKSVQAVTMKADSSPMRPPSTVSHFDNLSDDVDTTQAPDRQVKPNASNSAAILGPSTASTLQEPRPTSLRMPRPGMGKPARALYDFEGEAAFNELIIRAGQPFDIINEQLAGGWSLGVVWDEEGVPTRGLIPQGWYCYIQDFTRSPPLSHDIEPPPTPDLVSTDDSARDPSLPAAAVSPREIAKSASSSESMYPSPSRHVGSVGRAQSKKSKKVTEPAKVERAESRGTDDSEPSVSTPTPPNENRAAVEPHDSITVSAFLKIGNKAAHWQEVEEADAVAGADRNTKHQSVIEPESEASVFANSGAAIDGMPVDSNESNPIDWSAVDVSQPQLDTTSIPNAQTAPVEEAAERTAPAPETENTATAGPDWKGSIFGKTTFQRFASFVTSGAEDYVLSNFNLDEDERWRVIARTVPGGQSAAIALPEVAEEDEGAQAPVHPHDLAQAMQIEHVKSKFSSAEHNHHFVIAGPAGPKWKSKSPPFLVQVHHPEMRTKLNGMHEYTVYHVTSTYPLDDADPTALDHSCVPYDPLGGPYPPGSQSTVVRRFTQFEWLHQVLAKHYSALLIPPMPEKQYSGRFASDFIETRRADLEMWISRIVRHPILRYSEPIRFFLNCQHETEWRNTAAVLLRHGESKWGVYARTWHPDFNFDSADAAVEADRMEAFLKALEKTVNGVGGHDAGKQGILAAYKLFRECSVATSSTYRDLSYVLLRTITGAGAGPCDGKDTSRALNDDAHRIHGPPMGNIGRRSETGATNEHGAWCWREDCQDCLNLTSAMQNTAECLQNVADIYESHARETLLRQHERFKEVSRPHTLAQALLETHRTTLSRYREATGEVDPFEADAFPSDQDRYSDKRQTESERKTGMAPEEAEKVAARCETVINVTLSEMDRIHDERVQDYHALGRSLLDGQIELHESILEQLKAARLHYDEEYYEREPDFHVLPSRYQAELSRPKKPSAPLLMPSAAHGPPGGLKSAAGGMGLLISQATGNGGVIRPASMEFESMAMLGDRSPPLASPRATDMSLGYTERIPSTAGGGGKGGLLSSFLAPVTIKQRPFATNGDKSDDRLVDSTNTYTTRASGSASTEALKAINMKFGNSQESLQQQQSTSSYFSAIWR
ncbi:related to Sorting nexin 9 [Melanopsichium pennsylvanicum]|uniref:Related to Sorting nexin 9 n=2 Tax=Melanopsichium pennsylvanicum TaxID=63383 RepID=A0AAJ5C514_9BASI|nr:related to Sorting nexin 9 [Melanopsichium pennsylvanicum 4]SNX84257.1 related to Sorting nexin 9 [Melanopsichium pennsylvanicum]